MTTTDEPLWVGVDLGTQSVRAIAVTGTGEVLGSGTESLQSRRDGDRHEQDPEQWWTAVCAALRAALGGIDADRVAGVAVDATSGTVLLTDGYGRAASPALMYDDTRAADHVEAVNQAGTEVWSRLGYQRMQPAWALPKLLWLLQERGAGTGVHLTHQVDFVNRRLVGHAVASDLSNALKSGVDLVAEDWPREVLDALGVPEEVLPDVVRSGSRLGTVGRDAAEATGLPEGAVVVAGMTDGCAAQLGAGATTAGSWNSVLGTTLVLKGVTRDLLADPTGAVYCHRAPDGGWLPGGASSSGAGVVAREFAGADLDALTAAAAQRGTPRATAYPLVSQGERFPFVAPQARPFVLGTPRDEVERFDAVLHGVAYVERLCFDYLDLLGADVDGVLTATGGATRSRYWCQLRADVLGRSLDLPQNAEPALGMAVLAASMDSPRNLGATAARMVHVAERLDPRDDRRDDFDTDYLTLVTELEDRGWLLPAAAEHARKRTTS